MHKDALEIDDRQKLLFSRISSCINHAEGRITGALPALGPSPFLQSECNFLHHAQQFRQVHTKPFHMSQACKLQKSQSVWSSLPWAPPAQHAGANGMALEIHNEIRLDHSLHNLCTVSPPEQHCSSIGLL